MLTSPGVSELYLLLLAVGGLVGCALLCQGAWGYRRWLSFAAWNVAALAWGWLVAIELLWNLTGWDDFVAKFPRALLFRLLVVVSVWLMVIEQHRRRDP